MSALQTFALCTPRIFVSSCESKSKDDVIYHFVQIGTRFLLYKMLALKIRFERPIPYDVTNLLLMFIEQQQKDQSVAAAIQFKKGDRCQVMFMCAYYPSVCCIFVVLSNYSIVFHNYFVLCKTYLVLNYYSREYS